MKSTPLVYTFSIVLVLVGLMSQNIYAAEAPSEQDFLQEFPVVLSASRLTQPISETPNATTVIDRKMIDASGARNIVELFRLVPGMYVGYHNGHTPTVAYRGSTDGYARRMQVLIDGRTVYLPPYGHVNWAELPLDIDDIERIEVVRGPSAASHGSNSVQGVISIITRPASAIHNAQVSVNRGSGESGGGIKDVSARLGSNGERWDYRLTLASRSDTGFENVYPEEMHDDSSTKLMNVRAAFRPTTSDSIDFQLGYGNSTSMEGGPTTTPDDWGTLRDVKTVSNFQQISWLHTTQNNNDVHLSYYHIDQSIKDDRYAVPNTLVQNWYADDTYIHRHEIELQHTLNTSSVNRVVWGTGMRYDSVNSPFNLPTPLTWKEYRVFAHDEWRMTSNTLLNTGAMVERSPLGQTRVSPRVAYNYHLTPRHTFRASVSIAYRNPEMFEEFGYRRYMKYYSPLNVLLPYQEYQAAGGLDPERTLAREIGYIGQLDDAGSTIDLRVYHDHINNIIWLDPVSVPGTINDPLAGASAPWPYSFRNDFSATHRGIEGTLNLKIGERNNLTANYAHQLVRAEPIGALTLTPADPVAITSLYSFYAEKYSRSVPLNSASILLSVAMPEDVRFGFGYYYQDKVNVLDRSEGQPIMRRLDFKVAKRFRSAKNPEGGNEIAFVTQNVLNDTSYTDYNPAAHSQIRSYITAKLEF